MSLPDASEHVATDTNRNDGPEMRPLPALTADLFIAAGVVAAERLVDEPADARQIERILRRVVNQCAALRAIEPVIAARER